MKRFFVLVMFVVFALVLGSCAQEKESKSAFEPAWLEVEPSINPEKGEVNEKVTFEAKVTYGDKKVDDADEVMFEIWRAHDEEHENIAPENAGDGVYRLEKTFDREGTYYFVAHVTAENMHNMPRKEFVIGKPSQPEEDPSSTTMGEDNELDEDNSQAN